MGMRCIVSLFLLLTAAGCLTPPETPATLEEFRRAYRPSPAVSLQGKKVLTLEEAQKAVLLNNPTYRAAYDAIRAARFNYYSAWSAALPELSVQTDVERSMKRGYDLKHPPAGIFHRADRFTTTTALQATWLLFDGMERELNILIARQDLRSSRAAKQNVKRLLLRAAAYAFYDIILAAEEKRIHQADFDFQRAALRQAEVRFANGHVSKAAVLNFQILAVKAQSAVQDAAYRETVARNALAALLGSIHGELPPRLELPPAEPDKEETSAERLLEYAIAHRPDLKQSKLRFETAYYNRMKSYADFFPTIRLSGGFGFDTYAAKYGKAAYSRSYYAQPGFFYGISGEWNIFRGFQTLNLSAKWKALEEMARQEVNTVFLEVVTEVRDAWANCRNNRRQVQLFQEIARSVQEQRDLVYSEYQNGRETITRLNEAQSELVSAHSRLAAAQAALRKAQAQLDAAVNSRGSSLR